MKQFVVASGLFLLLLAGCAASDVSPSAPEKNADANIAADSENDGMHKLSAELSTAQGGTETARDYVMLQAKQACESIKKEVYVENLASETTWRGGRAEVTFACVEKGDPRLKQK